MIATPRPRFLAREDRLGDSFPLTDVLTASVAVATVSTAVAAFPIFAMLFSFEKASKATARPPRTSSAPIISVALSTPLQSPSLIASQFVAISRTMTVNPCIATPHAASLMFQVKTPIPIAMLVRPLTAVSALFQFTPFSEMSLMATAISPIP